MILSSPVHLSSGNGVAPVRRLRAWAGAGALLGLGAALLLNLPAAWLATAVAQATDGRFLLAQAEGTLWQGSALPVLTGGPGSRDASVLPSRLQWQFNAFWGGVRLQLSQPCCMSEGITLEWRPGGSSASVSLLTAAAAGRIGDWPAAWLEGLGAPWNTLKPGGQLRLSSQTLRLTQQDGRWELTGQLGLELLQTSSRLAPLDPLGSYRLSLNIQPGQPGRLQLGTLEGALQLQGQGELRPRGVSFRGEAKAMPGQEAALNNLLNIIGRRQGASAVISIG